MRNRGKGATGNRRAAANPIKWRCAVVCLFLCFILENSDRPRVSTPRPMLERKSSVVAFKSSSHMVFLLCLRLDAPGVEFAFSFGLFFRGLGSGCH